MRLEPNQAPYEGGWVFSSTGDIIRGTVLPPESIEFGRLGLAGRNLPHSAVSRARLAAQGVKTALLFPSDCRLCSTPPIDIPLIDISQPICRAGLARKTSIYKPGTCASSVIGIPVAGRRAERRARRFCQAELIARRPAMDGLERARATVSKIGLVRTQPGETRTSEFRVKHLNRVAGRRGHPVEGVLTTGTTANESARILRRAAVEKFGVADDPVSEKSGVAKAS